MQHFPVYGEVKTLVERLNNIQQVDGRESTRHSLAIGKNSGLGNRFFARCWAMATVSNHLSRAMIYTGLSLHSRAGGLVNSFNGIGPVSVVPREWSPPGLGLTRSTSSAGAP